MLMTRYKVCNQPYHPEFGWAVKKKVPWWPFWVFIRGYIIHGCIHHLPGLERLVSRWPSKKDALAWVEAQMRREASEELQASEEAIERKQRRRAKWSCAEVK